MAHVQSIMGQWAHTHAAAQLDVHTLQTKLEFMEIEIGVSQIMEPIFVERFWPMDSPFMGQWAYKHTTSAQ